MSGSNGQIKQVKPEAMHRRAFQRAAADTIDVHAQVLDEVRGKVKAQGEFMADMSVRIDEMSKNLILCERLVAEATILRERGWRGRLRWLVTGK